MSKLVQHHAPIVARARSGWRGTDNVPRLSVTWPLYLYVVLQCSPSIRRVRSQSSVLISRNSLYHNITPSFLVQNAKHKAELTGHRRSRLIQNLTQPLHTIQQHVSLPQHRLTLRILHFRPICLNDPMYFVDGGMQTTRGDEAGEFATRPSSQYQY